MVTLQHQLKDPNAEWTVKKITDVRLEGDGFPLFKVTWQGKWPTTWVPLEDMQYVDSSLQCHTEPDCTIS